MKERKKNGSNDISLILTLPIGLGLLSVHQLEESEKINVSVFYSHEHSLSACRTLTPVLDTYPKFLINYAHFLKYFSRQ